MKRTIAYLLPLSLAAVVLFSHDARAIHDMACCTQSTSRLDSLLNPVSVSGTGAANVASDEAFFTQPSGPPNVLFIIDNSGSMDWWPFDDSGNLPGDGNSSRGPNACARPAAGACDCAAIDRLGYDPSKTYEREIKHLKMTKTEPDYYDEWFRNERYYRLQDGSDYGYGKAGTGPDTKYKYGTVAQACEHANARSTCETCLDTKGYYLDREAAKSRVKGNFLNFVAPRALMARKVIKQVLRDIEGVRLAVAFFNKDNGTTKPWILQPFNPPCNQANPNEVNSHFYSNRQSIASAIESHFKANGGTPTTRAMALGAHYLSTGTGNGTNTLDTAAPNWAKGSFTAGNCTSGNCPAGQSAHWDLLGNCTCRDRGLDVDAEVSDFTEKTGHNQLSICFECTFTAIILMTDGKPEEDHEEDLIAPLGPSNRLLGSEPLCNGPDQCGSTGADEIAEYIANHDMRTDLPGVQKIATYTIGFALMDDAWTVNLLDYMAKFGDGKFFRATDTYSLRESLMSIFKDINNRNTAFSSAAIAPIQTGNAELAALVPRMEPFSDRPWVGKLYRFNLFNEFIDGVEHPEGDTDDAGLTGVYLVDNTPAYNVTASDGTILTVGHIVTQDTTTGRFVQKGTVNPAVPFWEAGSVLQARCGGQAWKESGCSSGSPRKIWTVIASEDTDHSLTDTDTRLELTTANWDKLIDYLGIKDSTYQGVPFCPHGPDIGDRGYMLTTFKLTLSEAATYAGVALPSFDGGFTSADQAKLDEICAKLLIQYVRGRDLADEDGDLNRNESRQSILGDIFHSSPVLVSGPADKWTCGGNGSNQCNYALFTKSISTTEATELEEYTTGCPTGLARCDAYDVWWEANKHRQLLVLVGANDGMLHAFNAGVWQSSTQSYSAGDGNEVWAFISPDQLARLQELVGGNGNHAYFVDGDIMVRDIWYDSDGDNKKDANEFHTLVVAAEGRGGIHYFALEPAFDTANPPAARSYPNFRWIFPQPCSDLASTMGKTLLTLAPKPPPIGPVLLQKSGSPYTRFGVPAEERWVVALSGGWSPTLERGRGFYIVDAWNGAANTKRVPADNLLWRWEKQADGDPSEFDARLSTQKHILQSIAAPVGLADYGESATGAMGDTFFDTAVVGDTMGQVWVARMLQPGILDDTTGLVTNWSAARTFEIDAGNVASGKKVVRNVWPFFYLPSIAIQPSYPFALRAFLGTGNRYALLEKDVGTCRYDNPLACVRYGCDVVDSQYQFTRMSFTGNNTTRWSCGSGACTPVAGDYANTRASNTGAFCAADAVDARLTRTITKCGDAEKDVDAPPSPHVACGLNANGNFVCDRVDLSSGLPTAYSYDDWSGAAANQFDYDNYLPTGYAQGPNRFYGFWAYGDDRAFDPADGSQVAAFDAARLTDTDLTDVSCLEAGDAGPGAQNRGWYFSHKKMDDGSGNYSDSVCESATSGPELARRTATSATVIEGTVMWNSISPTTVWAACSTGNAEARFYQADFISGVPGPAESFGGRRFLERTVLTPPPEPNRTVQISRSGQIRVSTMSPEPGKEELTTVTVSTTSETVKSFYELPVTKSLHNCRHTTAGCNTPNP